MSIEVLELSFPGGKKVNARIGDFTVETDQSVKAGGEASAPEPFDLFLASIATCAGVFALGFCQSRKLPTDGLGLRMECEKNPEKKLFGHIRFHLTLPQGFPEKHRGSIERAIATCTVKRHITDAELPSFEVVFEN